MIYFPQVLNGASLSSPPFNSTTNTSRMCGTDHPAHLETSGSNLYVQFESNNDTSSATGFSLNFTMKSLSCNQNLQVRKTRYTVNAR